MLILLKSMFITNREDHVSNIYNKFMQLPKKISLESVHANFL